MVCLAVGSWIKTIFFKIFYETIASVLTTSVNLLLLEAFVKHFLYICFKLETSSH